MGKVLVQQRLPWGWCSIKSTKSAKCSVRGTKCSVEGTELAASTSARKRCLGQSKKAAITTTN